MTDEIFTELRRGGCRVQLRELILPASLPRERLEQIRGFLIYVARTYRWMTPYLKGLHLTIDGWRPGRDADGYKAKDRRFQVWRWEQEEWIDLSPQDLEMVATGDRPTTVKAAPRLASDIAYLEKFTSRKTPAVQSCRATGSMVALYLLGNASGNGMGSGLWDGVALDYEQGNWATRLKDESSNWKEASNLLGRI